MKVQLKGGKELVIIIPVDLNNLRPSKSGRTLTVASTGGFKATELLIHGKPVHINLNAYVTPNEKTKP